MLNQPMQFVQWLSGYLDAVGDNGLTKEQTKKIADKLNGVFEHGDKKEEVKPTPSWPGRDSDGELMRC